MTKLFLNILVFLLISISFVKSQNITVHQFENEFYKKNRAPQSATNFNLPKKTSSAKLNKAVFGYLPYWEYYAGTHKNIRYDLLTHLAVFSFEADSLGNLKNPTGWPWNDIIQNAKANNVKLILTVTNFNGNEIHALLTNQTYKANLLSNIYQKVKLYSFNGVNIDFESVKTGDRNSVISSFFAELKSTFVTQNMNVEISFASPIVNWGGWDFSMIAKNLDLFFIMGYDFYGDWSTTTGPSAPLIGGNYNLTRSLSFDYYTVVQSNPEKLILGVPYYGNYWRTKSPNPYTTAKGSTSKRYRHVVTDFNNKEQLWDYSSNTPWLRWQDTTWNQIWYDDKKSLTMKYDLAIKKKIAGIGIWALGYDDGRSELWKLIDSMFTSATSSLINPSIPTSTSLDQNYPNPFNPETTIKYKLHAAGRVNLKVYDLLGREVAELVNEFQQAGEYNYKLSSINYQLSSGVYFYSLRTGNFIQSKKMVLTK